MKNICCCIILVFISCVSLNAQKIIVQVQINTGSTDSFPAATIQLFSTKDSGLLFTQLAIKSGNDFLLTASNNYRLKLSAIGFETIEKFIKVSNQTVSIAIDLKKHIQSLDEVKVVRRKSLIKEEDDKSIVDAEPLANSSSNAYEVLEKVPGVIADQDGNIYLSSMTPATIQINGRDVKLSTADLASLLKSLPANSVSKIELLRSPSAKYDAASSGGIVNIVLKKGVKIGASGSMNVGYFQGVYNTKFAGFNINKGTEKFSSHFSYQQTEKNNFEELNSIRQLPSSNALLSQKARTVFPSVNNYFGVGADFNISKKINLAYDLRISANDNRSDALNQINILSALDNSIKGDNASAIKNRNTSTYIGNNISGKFKIDTSGSEWTLQMDYNRYRYSNEQLYNNYGYLPVSPTLFGNGNSKNSKDILSIQSDLVLKIKKGITFETGFKSIVSNSQNSAVYYYQKGNSGIQVDPFQTNTFKYQESISSAYLQLSKKIAGFTIKPGLRLEATDISGRQLFPKDTNLAIKRTDVFPYLYLRHKLLRLFGFELNGNAIIRRSITRPYYEILNPYPKYIDQYLYDIGNPNLQPQFTNNYEFNITAADFTIFSLGVNNTKNIFSNITIQDDASGIAYRTYNNLGSSKEVYLRFVGGLPPGGKYFFYAGAQQNINSYEGFYQNKPLSYKRNSWVFFMYHNLKLNSTFNVTVNGFMRLKGLQNFYELNSFGALNVSFNKSLMHKTANLILSFNDILLTNQNTFSLQQGNVNASGTRVNDTRRVGLTFRYNFGIKPREEKKQLFEQPAESKEN